MKSSNPFDKIWRFQEQIPCMKTSSFNWTNCNTTRRIYILERTSCLNLCTSSSHPTDFLFKGLIHSTFVKYYLRLPPVRSNNSWEKPSLIDSFHQQIHCQINIYKECQELNLLLNQQVKSSRVGLKMLVNNRSKIELHEKGRWDFENVKWNWEFNLRFKQFTKTKKWTHIYNSVH